VTALLKEAAPHDVPKHFSQLPFDAGSLLARGAANLIPETDGWTIAFGLCSAVGHSGATRRVSRWP
jgi:hypothetical protein